MNEIVELAKTIATRAHAGQKRKFSGLDYITHPAAVAAQFPNDLESQAVAWLHDVPEDCPDYTSAYLQELGIPLNIISRVYDLTRRKGESYADYIWRLRGNDLKMADVRHNLSDLKPGTLRDKYELAIILLEQDPDWRKPKQT